MAYTFDQICNFKRGEEYFESNQHSNTKFRLITDPVVDGGQVRFTAKDLRTGREIKYLFTRDLMHYCARIYDQPAYMHPNDLAGWLQ